LENNADAYAYAYVYADENKHTPLDMVFLEEHRYKSEDQLAIISKIKKLLMEENPNRCMKTELKIAIKNHRLEIVKRTFNDICSSYNDSKNEHATVKDKLGRDSVSAIFDMFCTFHVMYYVLGQ